MKKLVLAALCCGIAAPAIAQNGHVHTATCNHQFTENQGAINTSTLAPNSGSKAGGMKFILNNLGGVEEGTDAYRGFQAAAAIWSSLFTDDITIRLDVRFSQLAPNILGSTGSTTNTISYSALKLAMAADAKSVYDHAAVASLQTGAALAFVSPEAGDCTNVNNPSCQAISSTSRTLDNDNTFDNLNIQINTAQAKALGLNPTYAANNPGGRDGSVSFSNQFVWDFDRSDGITPGAIDFVGVAAHEIGHALGFRSGVDLADVNANLNRAGLDNLAWGTVHDLFRYGQFNGQNTLDWSIGGTPCYSINGGQNCLALLSTGATNGDGRQASHWKDDALTGNLLGIMDPTATGPNGTRPFMAITQLDLIAFDAMGFDLRVPEPATWAMMISGFGFVGAAVRRRRRIAQVSFG